MRYHPDRFRNTRPYAKKISSLYKSAIGAKPPTNEFMQEASRLISDSYGHEIETFPLEQRPRDSRIIMKEINVACYYSAFNAHGRNLFHLSSGILEEFLETDVENIELDAISFPYECFYLSFGKQDSLSLYDNKRYVDGAYIFAYENLPLQIALSTLTTSWDYSNQYEWMFNSDKYYYIPIKTEDKSKTFGELIEIALENELREHKDDEQIPNTWTYTIDENEINIINKRPESAKKDQEEISLGFETFRKALRLIVNSLCYISQYKEDIEEEWIEGIPEKLIKKVEEADTEKKLRKATSKLTSMGYSKVKICGKKFTEHNSESKDGEIRPHWRRGHWRKQPYGKGLQERKLLWIRPTIVNKEKGEPISGHIYEVEEKNGGQG